ncbi:MAG: hypothetical protein ACM3US_11960 [Sphingomonadaceae bacterium]
MAQSVAVNETRFSIPLSKMSLSAWPGRTDTKGIVGALMISLAMIGILQFGERLDTLFFGGLFPVSGRVISIVLIGLGTMMYGVVGGLIVSEINPLIATATGTSPIAPFWLLTNASQVLSAYIAGRVFKNVITWRACILNAFLASLFLIILYIPMHIFYFRMPVEKMVAMYTFQTIWSLSIPAVFLRALLKVVKDAGFVEE